MSFKAGQLVTVFEQQLHSNNRNVTPGTVVSVEGSSARVQLQGEDVARSFPLDSIKSSESVRGFATMSPFENQVIDAIRRY